MKVNLLPKQYIKNEASKFIILFALFICLILVGSASMIGFYFSIEGNKNETNYTEKTVQSNKLDKQILELQEIHNSDLQKQILDIKSEKYLVNEMMTALSIAAQSSSGQILSYDLIVQNDKNNEKSTTNTNEIEMAIIIEAPNKIELSKFQEEVLKITWCKEAYLKSGSITSTDERWQGEYNVILSRDQNLYALKTDKKE